MNTSITVVNTTTPHVTIKNHKAITTSQDVSSFFNKRHDDVLKKIRNLDCSQEFSARNFAEAEYIDEQGKPRPMYEMTKDGFVFLVMGFTGKKAAQFKEAYIAEFNRMEAELTKPKKTTVDQRTPLRDAVNLLVSKKGLMYQEAYSIVHQRFSVESIDELQLEQLPIAIEYIHRLALEGEFIPAKNDNDKKRDIDAHNIKALTKHYEAIYTAWKVELYPALQSVDSPIAHRLYDRFKDGYAFLMLLHQSITGKHPVLTN